MNYRDNFPLFRLQRGRDQLQRSGKGLEAGPPGLPVESELLQLAEGQLVARYTS